MPNEIHARPAASDFPKFSDVYLKSLFKSVTVSQEILKER